MPAVPTQSPLAQNGPVYIKGLYMSALTKPLDERHVRFVLLPASSQLRIESVSYTEDGEVGKYKGQFTTSYTKADLARLLPHPLLYTGAYPATYADIADYLRQNYAIVLDQGEFRVAGSTDPTPLVDTTLVNWPPVAGNDVLSLEALPASIRWKTGTTLRLRIPKVSGQVSLPALISQPSAGTMSQLTDQPLVE